MAAVLAFLVFPPRKVAVEADGSQKVVVSRTTDLDSLLKLAGVSRAANDVVVRDAGVLRVERAIPVTVEVDGRVLTWRTRAQTVKDLLTELGVDVSPYDGITFNGVEVSDHQSLFPGPLAALPNATLAGLKPASAPESIDLVISRAVPFTIVEDGQVINFKSARPTVAMALRDAGIRLGPADEVFPALTSPLVAGQEVRVKHAYAVTIRTGESSRVVYTHQKLLKDALAEAGLSLGPEDRVEPGVDTEVRNGMVARLVRVVGRTLIEREDVPRRTVFRPDENLQGMQTRIVQGRDGVRVREYRIVIEDGVETEKKLIAERLDPEPINTVIYYAESSVRATGVRPDNLQVIRVERMYATWYNAASSGRAPTDPYYGITASGVPVTRGIVAVDPNFIPLGTRLYVPGYGFAIAGDTGGGVIGNMIDLGYPDGVTPDGPTGWIDVFILAP
ncbi:MAG TPA: ubiquitin-like domain-containing protein [Dehalococcoidia bacterium]|nr:ubiquitin-like domain-containing protein [Dehalococcoidia bacterium]